MRRPARVFGFRPDRSAFIRTFPDAIWCDWGGDPDKEEEPGDVPVDQEYSDELLDALEV